MSRRKRQQRHSKKDAPGPLDATVDLVEMMTAHGAQFRFTRPGGTILVKNLGKLPADLVERFFNSDAALLASLVKAKINGSV